MKISMVKTRCVKCGTHKDITLHHPFDKKEIREQLTKLIEPKDDADQAFIGHLIKAVWEHQLTLALCAKCHDDYNGRI